ncbi:MAG: T9SS type A sorting domain-containing protein [Chitinophagaceae bacterium]
MTKVEWYDLQGKKVWNENLQNATISVPSIAQGLYIIKSHFEDGSVVFTKFRISQ